MCDVSGVALGDILRLNQEKLFHPIYYAIKTLNREHKTTLLLLVVVYAFETFQAYLVGTRVIMHTDHAVLLYIMEMKGVKI